MSGRNNNQKKVLFITNNYPAPDYRRLWKKATSLIADGWEVRLICPAGYHKPGRRRLNGVTIYYYARAERGEGLLSWFFAELLDFLEVGSRVLGLFLTGRFKVLHVLNPSDTLGIWGTLYSFLGIKFVYEVNESYPRRFQLERLRAKKLDKWMIKRLKRLERRLAKSADLIVVPDHRQKARMKRVLGEKRPEIITIEPLPDLKDFYQPFVGRDYKRGFPHMALYAGSLKQERGIVKLIRAIDFIVNRSGRRDILFVLAGDGCDAEILKEYAQRKGVADFVHFTGWLSQKRLLAYLAEADMGLLPEPVKNGNPVLRDSVWEFLAMGKPIVSFDTKGRESRIGKAGTFVFDQNEITFAREIVRIVDNKKRSEAMGEMGKIRVERDLNWFKSEIKLLEAYERLGDKKGWATKNWAQKAA